MKLLFDQNLSFKLARRLSDLFPNSSQVRLIAMEKKDDLAIWEYAKINDYVLITQDSDYFELSTLMGYPPKVIWLRCGNQTTEYVERLIRVNHLEIIAFANNPLAGCLEFY